MIESGEQVEMARRHARSTSVERARPFRHAMIIDPGTDRLDDVRWDPTALGLTTLSGNRLPRLRWCLSWFGRGPTPRADVRDRPSVPMIRVPASSEISSVTSQTLIPNAG